MELDIPIPHFENPIQGTCKLIVCPKDHYKNGFVVFGNLLLGKNNTTIWASCEPDVNFCNYIVSYGIHVQILWFEILQSTLVLKVEENKWYRYCRTEEEIQGTYNHERQHILNAREYANDIVNIHIPRKLFYSKNECELFKKEAEDIIYEKFRIWKKNEANHENPNSPKYSGLKHGELCDVDD